MGMIVSLGLGFGVSFSISFVDSAGLMFQYVYNVQCTTLRFNPVIYRINIEELHLLILCYVNQLLTKRTRYLLAFLMDEKSFGFILHTCAPK